MNNVYGSGTKEHFSKKIHSLLERAFHDKRLAMPPIFFLLLVNGNSTTNELYADILTFWKRSGSQIVEEFFQANDCGVAKNELFIVLSQKMKSTKFAVLPGNHLPYCTKRAERFCILLKGASLLTRQSCDE